MEGILTGPSTLFRSSPPADDTVMSCGWDFFNANATNIAMIATAILGAFRRTQASMLLSTKLLQVRARAAAIPATCARTVAA